MTSNLNKSGQWIQYITLALAFIGMLAATAGSIQFFSYESQVAGSSIWPLPGFVLAEWAALGVLGLIAAYFGMKSPVAFWPSLTWFVAGALLPLIILGVFSIGLFVLISFLFILTSAILITIQKKMNWLNIFGIFMLGAVCNLGLVFIFITLGSVIQRR